MVNGMVPRFALLLCAAIKVMAFQSPTLRPLDTGRLLFKPSHLIQHTSGLGRCKSVRVFESQSSARDGDESESPVFSPLFRTIYSFAGLCSAAAWVALSISALSRHPDPRFINCSWKHNILTMSQAFAFPLPVMAGAFCAVTRPGASSDKTLSCRLNLGIATTFLYTTASATIWAPLFACGYDLYSLKLKTIAGSIFFTTSLLALTAWSKIAQPRGIFDAMNRIIRGTLASLWSVAPRRDSSSTAALYATAAVGFLWFKILPLVSAYPLMTIPTILGKRLSRSAGAFTFLGAVVAYCLKDAVEQNQVDIAVFSTLRRGLGWGSALHLTLIALKLIGVDDGGLLLPGRGLWEVYPAMVAVPFATTMSLLIYAIVCLAAFSSDPATTATNND